MLADSNSTHVFIPRRVLCLSKLFLDSKLIRVEELHKLYFDVDPGLPAGVGTLWNCPEITIAAGAGRHTAGSTQWDKMQ